MLRRSKTERTRKCSRSRLAIRGFAPDRIRGELRCGLASARGGVRCSGAVCAMSLRGSASILPRVASSRAVAGAAHAIERISAVSGPQARTACGNSVVGIAVGRYAGVLAATRHRLQRLRSTRNGTSIGSACRPRAGMPQGQSAAAKRRCGTIVERHGRRRPVRVSGIDDDSPGATSAAEAMRPRRRMRTAQPSAAASAAGRNAVVSSRSRSMGSTGNAQLSHAPVATLTIRELAEART